MSSTLISPDLVERVLAKLGFGNRPDGDLDGLNTLYSAFSGSVPNDNIQKRIWLVGERTTPVTGGEAHELFENWLRHGTGGTCWPINGAMCALLESLGFQVRRIACTMMIPGASRGDANHGSVVVTLDGVDYLVDAQLAAFDVLPLLPHDSTQTDTGIHSITAEPTDDGFKVQFYPGHNREMAYTCMTEPDMDPVDHEFFLSHYHRSATVRGYSPFNQALVICRHLPDSIITIHRKRRIAVAADGSVTSTEIDDAQCRKALVEEFGVSEEIAELVPRDDPGSSIGPT